MLLLERSIERGWYLKVYYSIESDEINFEIFADMSPPEFACPEKQQS